MDQRIDKLEGAGKHIWLRYATQFTANGRTYTLEMGVPMPIGASTELREQLLTEADAGMNQLASHVENRAAQILQQAQPVQEPIPAATPTAQPAVTLKQPAKPTPTPAATSAPQTAAQEPAQPPTSSPVVHEKEVAQSPPRSPIVRETAPQLLTQETVVPPTRPTVGASMPAATTSGAAGGNLTIPEFIKLINDSMGLNPKQAMEKLKVKSLNGLNLRDALERLQRMSTQQPAGPKAPVGTDLSRPPSPPAHQQGSLTRADGNGGLDKSVPTGVTVSTNSVARTGGNEPGYEHASTMGTVHEEHPVQGFEEEINPDEEGEPSDDLEDLEESRELTIHEQVRARTLISRLRESRGATTANSARLQALENVIGDQISKQALHELVAGLWEVQSMRKLKVDQVEALISWAKEDDFANEVEAVLILLEEENYARGNR